MPSLVRRDVLTVPSLVHREAMSTVVATAAFGSPPPPPLTRRMSTDDALLLNDEAEMMEFLGLYHSKHVAASPP